MKRKTKRPKATAITDGMPLTEKTARIRRRMRSDGKFNHQHPNARRFSPAPRKKPWRSAARYGNREMPNLDSYRRCKFTDKEIQDMYFALRDFMDFFGGNRSLACRITGFTQATLYKWIQRGRVSAFGADLIGKCDEVPFTREMMRPDITEKGWKSFDEIAPRLYKQREENSKRQKEALRKRWEDE